MRQSSTRRKSTQGVGLGTPYVDYSGLFASMGIGPYTITSVWGPSGNPPAVGMEILRRFILTFDARQGRLGLVPTVRLHDPVPSPGAAILNEGLPSALSHDQNRNRRLLHDRFGNTTKPQPFESSAAMTSHNYKIRMAIRRYIE